MKGLQHWIETAAVSFAEKKAPGTATLLRRALHVVITSQISRMAAALSYRTVFGLIPVLAIGVAFLGGFASDEQIKDTIREVLKFSGLSKIVVEGEEAAAGALDPAGPATQEALSRSAELEVWLQELVGNVREVSFVAIGLTGLLMLIYAALSFMVEIERSANAIYHAPTGRSWARRVTQYWTTLTLGSLFLIGTFYVGRRLTALLTDLTDRVQSGAGGNGGRDAQAAVEAMAETAQKIVTEDPTTFVAAAAGVVVSLIISFLLLLFLYMTIPNARVSARCAAIGAGFAAIMWETGKWGFTLFVVHSAAQKLYGAIALIPLFLFWVYITWIIVLFGLQISYVLQNYQTFAVPEEEPRGPILVDPLAPVRVAAVVGRRFAAGETAAVSDIAGALGMDEKISLAILERLVGAGVLHRVPAGQYGEAFALARPAEQVRVRELLELAEPTPSGAPEQNEQIASLRRAQLEAASGATLADLTGPAPKVREAEPPATPTGADPAPAA